MSFGNSCNNWNRWSESIYNIFIASFKSILKLFKVKQQSSNYLKIMIFTLIVVSEFIGGMFDYGVFMFILYQQLFVGYFLVIYMIIIKKLIQNKGEPSLKSWVEFNSAFCKEKDAKASNYFLKPKLSHKEEYLSISLFFKYFNKSLLLPTFFNNPLFE